VASGKLVHELRPNRTQPVVGDAGLVNQIAYSPDGKRLLTMSWDRTIRVWSADSDKEVGTLGTAPGVATEWHSIALLRGGKEAVVAGWARLVILDLETAKVVRVFDCPNGRITHVSVSPDGKRLLTTGADGTDGRVRLWDVASGKLVRVFDNSAGALDVAFLPDGRRFLMSHGKELRLADVETGEVLKSYRGHVYGVTSFALVPQSSFVVSGSLDETVRLWRLPDPPPEKVGEVRRFERHDGTVRAVAYSPNGRYILSGSGWPDGDKTLRLWELATGKEVRRFEGHTTNVNGVAFSPDGRRALSGSDDNTVRLWDVSTGKEIRRFTGHTSSIHGAVAFSPDGRRALSGSADKTIRLWNVETGEEIRKFEGHENWINGVAFSPDGRRIVSGSTDNTIRLWDVETGKELKRFEEHQAGGVAGVAYSLDGRFILSGGATKGVRLWDVETGKEVRSFEGHTMQVPSVAFSPDGKRALSGSLDKTVRLWDVETGKELHRFDGHRDFVWSVAFSPDGRYAVSGSGGVFRDGQVIAGRDWTVRLWRLPDPPPPEEKVGEVWHVPTPGFDCFRIQFSPDGRRFLLGGGDKNNSVRIGDTATGATLRTVGAGHLDGVFTPDSRMVLTFHGQGAMKLWDVADGKEIRRFEGQPSGYVEADISPDGSRIVSAGMDGKVRIWDLNTGKALFVMDAYTPVRLGATFCGAKFTHDGRQVISYCSGDPVIRIWEPQTGKRVRELEGQERGWRVVGTLPGDRIVTFRTTLRMGASAAVRDLRTGKELLQIPLGETDSYAPHALLRDGRLLTAHTDRTLRLWSLDTGKEVGRVTVENVHGTFRCVAVSADGRYALAASSWSVAHLVRLPDPPPNPKP
jgi:WD40 repeat protein